MILRDVESFHHHSGGLSDPIGVLGRSCYWLQSTPSPSMCGQSGAPSGSLIPEG